MSMEASSSTQPLPYTSPLSGLPAQSQLVTNVLQTDIATVNEQTLFAETMDVLITSPLKRVIVIDEERHVKGIISDVDVLARIQRGGRPQVLATLADLARGRPARGSTGLWHAVAGKAQVAADVMNRQVVTIGDTASLQEAIDLMMHTHRKVLPVVNQDGRLMGTVGRSDVLRVLLEAEAS